MGVNRSICSLVFGLLVQSVAGAELLALDGPANYGHDVWIQRLRSLPDLQPGEHVFALLDLTHFAPDDTRQFVVEIRKSRSQISVYSGFPGKLQSKRVLRADEVDWFLADLEWQKTDELPQLFDPGVSDLDDEGTTTGLQIAVTLC